MNDPTLVVFITGFLQAHIASGLVGLAASLSAAAPADTEVWLYRWHQHDEIVQDLREHGGEYKRIIVVGHSYGVSTGFFAAKSVPELRIDHFVASDGVWRPGIHKPSFRSLQRGHRLLTPPNVEHLHTFFQTNNRRLRGHEYQVDPEQTHWVSHTQIEDKRHRLMDRIPELQILVHELTMGE